MKLRKFPFKSKGLIKDEEHEKCVNLLGSIYSEMTRLFEDTGHILRGRVQSYHGKPCPCIYVFYHEASFNDEQRGRMYILQDSEEGSIEIVFREWEGQPPLPRHMWDTLQNRDDRYNVCKYYKFKWRTFKVITEEDRERARQLIVAAKSTYERIYAI